MKMNEQTQSTVAATLEVLAVHCHGMARDNGFWDARYSALNADVAKESMISDGETGVNISVMDVLRRLNAMNDSELLMLQVTEIAEACEGLRHGNPPSEHIPDFTALEEEQADAIMRILDMAAARNCRIGEAVIAKMKFNAGRPRKHGKRF